MSTEIPNSLNSYGAVTGATGAILSGSGFASARTAKGIYTLTLDQPIDSTQCSCQVGTRGGALGETAQLAHTSDTVKTVTTGDAADAAADLDFDFTILRTPF